MSAYVLRKTPENWGWVTGFNYIRNTSKTSMFQASAKDPSASSALFARNVEVFTCILPQ